MANPNIVNVTTINGVTTSYTLTDNVARSILTNSTAVAASHVFKIESFVVSNTTSTAVNCTVTYYTAAVTQGSTLSGGTAYPICSTVSVPANASLVVIEKSNGIYLTENTTLTMTSSNASGFLTAVVSYEDIS